MKVLVSAFACIPNVGSEGGIGWFWVHEWARDHDVVVVTDIARRDAIEAELARHSSDRVRFVYFRPWWLRRLPLNSLTAQVLYQLWQLALVGLARTLHRTEHFDLAHHVSYGVFRQPSLLGRIGVPLVFGPVGGGEDAPWRLKRSMPWRYRLREGLRTLLNGWALVDPLLRAGLRRSALILTKTTQTARSLPPGFEDKVRVALEIGTVPRIGVVPRRGCAGRRLRLLYAGALLPLKGMHLGLQAVAMAIAQGADLSLSMVGDGPMSGPLHRQASALGLDGRIEWIGRIPQAALFEIYRRHDALLFPSLHDSSGNVVMEALSFALPVVCLDLGGPAEIVTDDCGCVVRTSGLGEADVVSAMAAELLRLQRDGDQYERLSAGALARSAVLDWSAQAARIKRWALELTGNTT